MKVFITKYALTKGIIEAEANRTNFPNMVVIGRNEYFNKPFWYESREDAIKHANELKQNKIASMKKQLLKVAKLKFQ